MGGLRIPHNRTSHLSWPVFHYLPSLRSFQLYTHPLLTIAFFNTLGLADICSLPLLVNVVGLATYKVVLASTGQFLLARVYISPHIHIDETSKTCSQQENSISMFFMTGGVLFQCYPKYAGMVENVGAAPLFRLPKSVCFCYTTFSVVRDGIEPSSRAYKARALTTELTDHMVNPSGDDPEFID